MLLRMTMIGRSCAIPFSRQEISGRLGDWAPGGELSLENVHVRTFLAANSRPSKDGILRVKSSAIKSLARLYPGAPVMRNHGMYGSDDMPVGTVFDAMTRTAKDQAEELMLPFYFSRHAAGDMMAMDIDNGVWKESSIHGLFESFSCSICGESLDPEDDGACTDHEPGQTYEGEMARIELDDPSEAPEFSLCWSGRLAGTRALAREIPGTMNATLFVQRRRSWLAGYRQKDRKVGQQAWLSRLSRARRAA